MSSILLIGANGVIGSRIAREALDRGHQVTAVVRDPAKLDLTHEGLTVETGDVLDSAGIAALAKGKDAVVSAVGGGDGPGHEALIVPAFTALVDALRGLGADAPRLIVVGGAGSLQIAPGVKVWDLPMIPEDAKVTMRAHGAGLEFLRTVTDVTWTCLSPSPMIEPGERTGKYRTGTDKIVAKGTKVSISTEDYAVALVDEVEKGEFLNKRFTVGY